MIKGIFTVSPPSVDTTPTFLDKLLKPQSCVVRVYVLRARGLQPMDVNNRSDPYCKLTLGDTVIDDSDNAIENTVCRTVVVVAATLRYL